MMNDNQKMAVLSFPFLLMLLFAAIMALVLLRIDVNNLREELDNSKSTNTTLAMAFEKHLTDETAKEKCGVDLNKRPIDNAQQQGCFDSVREKAKLVVEAATKK